MSPRSGRIACVAVRRIDRMAVLCVGVRQYQHTDGTEQFLHSAAERGLHKARHTVSDSSLGRLMDLR